MTRTVWINAGQSHAQPRGTSSSRHRTGLTPSEEWLPLRNRSVDRAPSPCPPPTHREFLELGFKYDNLLMEESAQILEIETFIPMLLQVGAWNGGHAVGDQPIV